MFPVLFSQVGGGGRGQTLLSFSDDFARADGALGNGWVGATWAIASGVAGNTPTLGSQLALNPGNPFNFTAGVINNWTPSGNVTEVGSGQGYGGGGSGYANFYQGSAGKSYIYQNILRAGDFYDITVEHNYRVTKSIASGDGGIYMLMSSAPATYRHIYRAAGVTYQLGWFVYNDTTDNTIKSVSVKKVAFADTLALHPTLKASDFRMTASITRTVPTDRNMVGLAFGWDSPTSPTVGAIFYIMNDYLYVDKYAYSAGNWTRTNLTSFYTGSTTHATGELHIEKHGSLCLITWTGNNRSTTFNLIDATIINGEYCGMWNPGNGATLDNFAFEQVETNPSLIVESPQAYRVWQRNGSNQANIAIAGYVKISGTYTIEASWNGGAYVDITASASYPGAFTGTLSSQAAGQGTLTVRLKEDPTKAYTVSYVGIGDVFAIAGQSNASGRFTNNQTYSHATLKAGLYANNFRTQELLDPTDDPTDQVEYISVDTATIPRGSMWTRLATLIMAETGLPVAFIPCAQGGTTIAVWQPNANHLLRTTLYGSMNYRITQAGGARMVLWYQGETDASNGTAEATYNSNLDTIANTIYSDQAIKLMPGKIHYMPIVSPDSKRTAINNAIATAWGDNANVATGPDFSDLDCSPDSWHMLTDDLAATTAQRWYNAIAAELGW